MELKKALEILKEHNKWRRGDDTIAMTNPKELGEAIDVITDLFEFWQQNINILEIVETISAKIQLEKAAQRFIETLS